MHGPDRTVALGLDEIEKSQFDQLGMDRNHPAGCLVLQTPVLFARSGHDFSAAPLVVGSLIRVILVFRIVGNE